MENQIKTLVVDGNAILKRSFYQNRKHSVDFRVDNQTVYLFLASIRKMLKEHGFTKVFIAWDGQNAGLRRYQLYSRYKANRAGKTWCTKQLTESEILKEKEEKRIKDQKVKLKKIVQHFFIRQLEINDVEADDIIAHYCKNNSEREHITIMTNDRDMGQLLELSPNINIIFSNITTTRQVYNDFLDSYQSEREYVVLTRDNFKEHLGVEYYNVLPMKIFTGDTSDNISGISQITEKSIVKYFPEILEARVTVNEIWQKTKDFVKKNNKSLLYQKCIANGVSKDVMRILKQYTITEEGDLKDEKGTFLGKTGINVKKTTTAEKYFKKVGCDISDETIKNLFTLIENTEENKDQLLVGTKYYQNRYRIISLLNPLLTEEEADRVDQYANDFLVYKDDSGKVIRGVDHLKSVFYGLRLLDDFRKIDKYQMAHENSPVFLKAYKEFVDPFSVLIQSEIKNTEKNENVHFRT